MESLRLAGADVLEDMLLQFDETVFKWLLKDRTTGKNIIWGTSDYEDKGRGYGAKDEVKIPLITGANSGFIQPRVLKAREQQTGRTRSNAEVFTPSWICNAQNNLIDEAWFGRKDPFNTTSEDDKEWHAVREKIVFPDTEGHTWQDYVSENRLEITCGEAPYLASRYDAVTGEPITDIMERIGLLDRKLRIVNENTDNEEDWLKWAYKAYQGTYAYEMQGDSLLIARENLLLTFADNKFYKFGTEATVDELRKIALILSWNIWQMDGITNCIPFTGKAEEPDVEQMVFGGFEQEQEICDPIPCIIKDWKAKETLEYRSMIKR